MTYTKYHFKFQITLDISVTYVEFYKIKQSACNDDIQLKRADFVPVFTVPNNGFHDDFFHMYRWVLPSYSPQLPIVILLL
jgi:hypothetical protein